MRPDATALKVSELDAVYRRAVMEARDTVRVVAFSVRWDIDGACWFERPLEVI